jgi:hypothetical protein
MIHRSNAGRAAKRVTMSLLASVCLIVGSPVVAVGSAANGGGAHKPVSATHGDCKNDNRGKHNGYDCPRPDNGGGEENSGGGDSGGEIFVY